MTNIENYEDQLSRIAAKLAALEAAGVRYRFDAVPATDPEVFGPVLRPDEIARFEERQAVALPEDYRQFLMRIGNGDHRVFALEDRNRNDATKRLPGCVGLPFPLNSSLDIYWECAEGMPYREWNEKREDPAFMDQILDRVEQFFRDPKYAYGTIQLAHYGCGIFFFLVVTGQERGNVWVDDRMNHSGIFPLMTGQNDSARLSFLDWYEQGLDRDWDRSQRKNASIERYFWWPESWVDKHMRGKTDSGHIAG